MIEAMVDRGMNLIRINLAHVQDDDDRKNIGLLRAERCVNPGREEMLPCIGDGFTQAIGHPIIEWAANIRAKLIVVYTTSGYTAEVISRYQPKQPIIAITHSYDAMIKLSLYWGVYSVLINYVPKSAEEAKLIAATVIEQLELANANDIIVMTMSMGKPGIPDSHDTNTIHVFKYEPGSLTSRPA